MFTNVVSVAAVLYMLLDSGFVGAVRYACPSKRFIREMGSEDGRGKIGAKRQVNPDVRNVARATPGFISWSDL